MSQQKIFWIIEVLNYKPYKVGFALSEKDGWYVGKRRFCSVSKARQFASYADAEAYINNRYDADRYKFSIVECRKWDGGEE